MVDEHQRTILATRDMCFGCFLVQHMTRSVFERSGKTYRVVMAQRLHGEARATAVICRRRAIRPIGPTSSVDSPGAAKGHAPGGIAKLPPTLNSCTERMLYVNGSGSGPNGKSRLSLSLYCCEVGGVRNSTNTLGFMLDTVERGSFKFVAPAGAREVHWWWLRAFGLGTAKKS